MLGWRPRQATAAGRCADLPVRRGKGGGWYLRLRQLRQIDVQVPVFVAQLFRSPARSARREAGREHPVGPLVVVVLGVMSAGLRGGIVCLAAAQR